MHLLTEEELKVAEKAVKGLFPESVKVYGCLFNMNRGKPHNFDVIADSWPDFRVIICKQKAQRSLDREGDFNIYNIYSKDKESLKKMLSVPSVINWNTFTLLAGVDINHLDAVKELCIFHNVRGETEGIVYLLLLEDASHLKDPECIAECNIVPLTADHAELVNSNWKYGRNAMSYNSVKNYITNFPSWCVLDKSGKPVSWILMYQHGAMGLLYTVPEHRRKGYAKLLISIMAKHLLEQGYPVYCFVDEGNEASYRLFTSMGFRHKPDYHTVWFQINEKL
ncbi:glycine N-acyltransferase-like protein 3 isoform X2 [Scleropages formosus]|uniref:glycine N-acyltransferase-like protein 3 isoform X2 n=1 Tax=Scleropages formosus TaxID=113540 RepID=UPI0008788AE8|nr:glycine N-acyltransferase-like protein 3 isoform X2 [Scleropages formosus]